MGDTREVLLMLRPVLTTLAEVGLAACDGLLSRVWLAGPADTCETCSLRRECASRTTCLHLVASRGLTTRVDGPFRRFPIGARLVGRIPVTHAPVIARDDLADLDVADPAWLALHGVHGFAALPLEHAERCIGVLAVFSRERLPEAQVELLTAAARLGAEAIGNVEAYRAVAGERNRLAAKNARLRAGLGLLEEPPAPAVVAEPAPPPTPAAVEEPIRFSEIQRAGILRALERAGWRVSGPRGAAAALGLRPTTLESKMKKLGIRRPRR